MADLDGTLIRFTGVLREDMHFIHVPAWETATVFDRPPEGDGTYAVDLLDGAERVVIRASPAIDFREGSPPDGSGLRLANVVVYVPMHPEARVLVFRRLEPSIVEIFRTELADQPPTIGDVSLGRGRPRGTFRITWTVKPDRPTPSSVFLVRNAPPALLVATGLAEPALNVDPRTLPGPTGRLAILATDGFRATTAIGPGLDGLSTEIRLEITVQPAGTLP